MTSKKTSFFLYLIDSDLQDTAFVRAGGGFGATSSFWPCCVIYLKKKDSKRKLKGKNGLLPFR